MELAAHLRRLNTMRTTVALSLALAVVAASCGGTDDAPLITDSATTAAPGTQPPATTGVDAELTFESEPIDVGPLFGGADDAVASDVESSSSADSCTDQDCDNGGDIPDQFAPAAADARFCATLDELAERPFPSDEMEALNVIQAWFVELRLTLVPSIVDDFEVLSSWLDEVAASQGSLNFDDTTATVDTASEALDEYVNTKCEGRQPVDPEPASEPADTDPQSNATANDPDLPDGLIVPVVEITSRRRAEPVPLFGSQSTSGGVSEPDPGFSVDAPDAAFCTALDIVHSRPQPSDDFEELVVADQYLAAIAPTVPDEIAPEFEIVRMWASAIVNSGSFADSDEPENGDAFIGAIESVNGFVDTRCLGR